MTDKSDRKELERRLEQARRMARDHDDPLTKERLGQLTAGRMAPAKEPKTTGRVLDGGKQSC